MESAIAALEPEIELVARFCSVKGRWAGMEEEAAAATPPPPPHVLVVDDCPLDRKIVEKLLVKNGMFQVTTVGSGKKAMELLGLNEEKDESSSVLDSKIDIILTDYCMPEMNGYDLLKAVKESNCLNSIPVVIMSSENKTQRIASCLDTGAEDFILKPLHVSDLQKLRSYITSISPASQTGTKRKVPHDLLPESSGSERRPRLTGVAVA